MSQYNPEIHHRRSIRLTGYDYAQAGLYFITLCCHDKLHLFGEVDKGEMIYNEFGTIAHEEWLNTTNIRSNCALHEFIIMPNHMHGIIEILFNNSKSEEDKSHIGKFQSPSQTIGSIIRGYKIATIKKIKEKIATKSDTGELRFAPSQKIIQLSYKIWQRNYYENIIRNQKAYENISNYIRNNPANWHKKKLSSLLKN